MKYKLASSTWDHNEIEAIEKVIASDNYSMGKFVELYERDFADFFDAKFCVMTSSGSTANLLMIASMFFLSDDSKRLKRGDEVIVPAVSWSTTYFPLQQYGLKVKFVDIDLQTLNFNLSALEEAISEKTKVIFAVNLLGNSNDFTKIQSLIGSKNITLLEDNCESFGATFNKKFTGTFGLMGTFSSFYSHHISTMEGGCIITDDEEIYHILLSIRAHGWTRNLPKDNFVTGTKSDDAFEESFKFVLPGYNVRPIEMSGAIGIEQLKKARNFIDIRRKNANYFKSKFEDISSIIIQNEIGKSSWFGFSMILKKSFPISRIQLISLLENKKIEYRPIVSGNFLKNKNALRYFDYEIHDTIENAEYLDKNGLFVGNHQVDIRSEIDHLYKTIKEVIDRPL